jgi:hypothetical protein
MNRSILIVLAALILIGVIGGVAYYVNRPTFINGDPWDYNLTITDLPSGWELGNNKIETAFDIEREKKVNDTGLVSAYSVEFRQPVEVSFFNLTSQVLKYDSSEAAHASLTNETTSAEWETITSPRTLGDETTVWHLKPVEDAPEQASYRVDFRYFNCIVSVAATGTTDEIKDATQALNYASKVLEKLQKSATPDSLRILGDRPDLRGRLLTQADLARVDPQFGERWVYNSLLLPSWTPNSAFDNPEGMAQLGRITGYQTWLIKPLSDEELKPEMTVTLFQQATVFQSPEQAQATLEKMVGLDGGGWQTAPPVGDSAKGWTQVFDASDSGTGQAAVATTEISFRMGAYTGSIRTQTSEVKPSQVTLAKSANELLALQLAKALAAKLSNP